MIQILGPPQASLNRGDASSGVGRCASAMRCTDATLAERLSLFAVAHRMRVAGGMGNCRMPHLVASENTFHYRGRQAAFEADEAAAAAGVIEPG